MSADNTQRDDETTVLPVADEEETVILPAVESNADSPVGDAVTADGEVSEKTAAMHADSPTVKTSESTSADAEVPVDKATAAAQSSPGTPDTARSDAAASPAPTSPETPAPAVALEEAPANGVRVAQLVWAGLVIMLGIFMIAISFLRFVSIPLLLISLIAALGVALMAAAVVTSMKKG